MSASSGSGNGAALAACPGVVELLRHARVDRVELVFAGDATIDDRLAQRGDRIPLLVGSSSSAVRYVTWSPWKCP